MSGTHTIGIDLGGTNIKAGICDADGRVRGRLSIDTQAAGGVDHVLNRMAKLIRDLIHETGVRPADVAGVGVGAPGPMSHARGVIYGAPNLPGWVNIPLRDRFAKLVGFPVVLENDANAAAFGEFIAGAGRGFKSLAMLTLGTGIGGGLVLAGQLWRGGFDNAGELGHMIVVPGGRPCPCGQRGCFERYGSANAVAERLAEATAAGEPSALAGRAWFDARDVLAAADAGDALALRIWDETCYYLAIGIVNIQHVLNPELVVLAGGLINAGPRVLDPVQTHFHKSSWTIAPDEPKIALAKLGDDAGLIGAAMLADPDRRHV